MSKKPPSVASKGFDPLAINQRDRKSGKPETRKTARAKLTVLIAPKNLEELKVRAARDKRKIYELVDEAITNYLGTAKAS